MSMEKLDALMAQYDASSSPDFRAQTGIAYMTLARKMFTTGELVAGSHARRADMNSVEVINDNPKKQCCYARCTHPRGRLIPVGESFIWVPEARPKTNYHHECHQRWMADEA